MRNKGDSSAAAAEKEETRRRRPLLFTLWSAGLVEDARPTAFAVRALTFAGLRSQRQRFGKLKQKAVEG